MKTEKRLLRIPVMLVTAESDLRVMSESFEAGAVAFLAKPFTHAQVQRVIRMLLRNTKRRRQLAA